MANFKTSDCAIPTVWCGNGNPPKRKTEDDKYYYKTGTRFECMKKGFGSGMYTERKENLSADSLQNIKYVGDSYELKFKLAGVSTLQSLRTKMSNKPTAQIERFLKQIFTRKGGSLDQRAYNSTILYLYRHGNGSVPRCSKIQP